jgi:putative PIG3 family NAD(P)H quinone oxidoreductase
MRAVGIEKAGGPEVLGVVEVPVPRPGGGEVLIAVEAAGVNRPDVFQRQGLYPPPPGASEIPGLEVAGTVVAVGEGVAEPVTGSRVCALLAGGGYAEYAVAPAGQCLPIPAGLSAVEAAVLPETYFTVWSNVFDRGRLQPGESLLVHGGSSGIGTTAIQMGAALGATVYATAGSGGKCAVCEELGATLAVNYRQKDFVEVLRDATGGRGIDVTLDMVAGPYLERNAQLAAVDGRIVIIAFLGGTVATVDLRPLMMKRLVVTGSTLRARSVAFKTEIGCNLLERVWPLLEEGRIRPVIHQQFALAEAAQAHALMESSQHIGKLVLRPD